MRALLVFFFVLSNTALAKDFQYVIVGGTKRLERMDHLEYNVPPWEQFGVKKKGANIRIAPGCVFYDIEYDLVMTEKTIVTRVQTGEFCDLSKYLFNEPTMLRVRNWDGVYFALEHSQLYEDDNGKYYITEYDLHQEWNASRLAKDVSSLNINPLIFCKSKKSISPSAFADYLDQKDLLKITESSVCFNKVVPVEVFLATQKQDKK